MGEGWHTHGRAPKTASGCGGYIAARFNLSPRKSASLTGAWEYLTQRVRGAPGQQESGHSATCYECAGLRGRWTR